MAWKDGMENTDTQEAPATRVAALLSLFSEPPEPILSHGLWAVVLELKLEACFFLCGEVTL